MNGRFLIPMVLFIASSVYGLEAVEAPLVNLEPEACNALARAGEYAATRRLLGYSWAEDGPDAKTGLTQAMLEGSPLIHSEDDLETIQQILELVYQSPLSPSAVRFKILEMCDPKHTTERNRKPALVL